MRELLSLIRNTGSTVSLVATAAGIPETRLNEILFTGRFIMDEWFLIEKALGLRPGQLSVVLGKSPCDFAINRNRKTPGRIMSFESRK